MTRKKVDPATPEIQYIAFGVSAPSDAGYMVYDSPFVTGMRFVPEELVVTLSLTAQPKDRTMLTFFGPDSDGEPAELTLHAVNDMDRVPEWAQLAVVKVGHMLGTMMGL